MGDKNKFNLDNHRVFLEEYRDFREFAVDRDATVNRLSEARFRTNKAGKNRKKGEDDEED